MARIPSKPAVELKLEPVAPENVRDFQLSLIPYIFSDIERQGLSVPDYNNRSLSVLATTADGQVVGGAQAGTSHNELEIYGIALNPDCLVEGAYTFLLRYVETAARTTFDCNRLLIELYDWQPREMYEREGYKVIGVVENLPRGHTKFCMEKVWPVESSRDAVQGYGLAATDLTIREWEGQAATAQLKAWLDVERQRGTAASAHPVPTRDEGAFAFRGLHADGSLAAGIVCGTRWNVVHVNILIVVPTTQRRGAGTAMLEALLQIARARGCDTIVLETSSWQARPFYEKNGYTLFATHTDLPPGFMRYRLSRTVPMNLEGEPNWCLS